MKMRRVVQAVLGLVASVGMVMGMQSAASASGLNVSVSKSWGTSTFYPDGDWLYVQDTDADGYTVYAKIQEWQCSGYDCQAPKWVDIRTGCYDTTSIGDNGSPIRQCNYDVAENQTVRVCEARYTGVGGSRYGSWYCSNETKS
ncbi:hypothetical protein ACIBI4_04985 [Streptomyces sp. NPDC050418]|uniref:hypothetical protein n=1 Tax=Streptomyces sp. NPDC050418 TaxID=3365612 RepID=UPI00378C7B95